MSFFYTASKTAAKRTAAKPGSRGAIPIALMQEMGCKACPRDKEADKLESPKLKPSGTKNPSIYLLGTSPAAEDDEANDHWRDKGGEALYRMFGPKFMQNNVRSNYIAQCKGDDDATVTECCRRRIVEDIEATKPAIIVTVGDAPLRWITGPLNKGSINALTLRGTVMVAKVGNHTAHVVPIIWPKFAYKSNRGKSEHELALEHDIAMIKRMATSGELPEPRVIDSGFTDNIELVTDLRDLERRLADMVALKRVALDIETNGLRPFRLAEPMLLTCAIGTHERTIAFPVDHPQGFDTPRARSKARELLGDWLLASGRKAAHNLSMELEWFHYFYGPKVLRETEWDDTMALCHTLDERKGTKSLEVQTIINFGFNLKSKSRVDAERLLEYPIKDVLVYNGMDAKYTDLLRRTLEPKVAERREDVIEYERKVRLAPTLTITEAKGLPCNLEVARKMEAHFNKVVADVEAKIQRTPEVVKYRQKFGTFSPSADDQVLQLMQKVLDRPEVRVENWDGSVRLTTDEEALSSMPVREVPSAPLILEYRGAAKLVGTYINPVLSGKILDRDGLIRAKYGSMIAETGRLNSDDPNIQNWPKRKFKEIRRIMTAEGWQTRVTLPDGTVLVFDEDRCFLSCDYGQIEFRVVGMASEDEEIVKACWTGYDVHKFWAERVVALYPEIKDTIVREFKVDWDEKGLKTLRQEAKNKWVFPQLFGASVNSCAQQLWLPTGVAEELAEEFWDTFRGAKRWQEKLLKTYERNLYVETLSGRRRRGALSKNQIINHPIQGTAAEIVTRAMVELSERGYAEGNPDIIPNLNVHDDLTFLPKVGDLDATLSIVKDEMCRHHFDFINVPLMVEASIGVNWCDLEEIKKYRSDELFNLPNPYKEHA